MTVLQIHPSTRPVALEPLRLSDASALDLAITQLSRIRRAIADGIHEAGPTGKLRKLSLRDRDAQVLDIIDLTLAELRRGRT